MKSNDVACLRIHVDPDPLLVGLFVDKAGHFIRFHLEALDHDLLRPAHGLDVKMVRQGGNTSHQKVQ